MNYRRLFFFTFLLLFYTFLSCEFNSLKALTNDINICDSLKHKYDSLFIEGDKNYLMSNFNKSLLLYGICININPESSASYYQIANIYFLSKNYNKSLIYSRKAFLLEKENKLIILQLAKLYQTVNKYDSAIYFNNLLLKQYNSNPDFVLNLAYLYISDKKVHSTLKVLITYKSTYGLTEDIALTLYQVYKLLNKQKACLEILRESANKFQEDSRFYELLGDHYLLLNLPDSSVFYFNKLRTLDPSNDKGYLSLIDFYRTKSDTGNLFKFSFDFLFNQNYGIEDKYDLIKFYCNDSAMLLRHQATVKVLIDSLCRFYLNNLKLKLFKIDFLSNCNFLISARDSIISVITDNDLNYNIYEKLFLICNRIGDFKNLRFYSSIACVKFGNLPYPYFFNGVANFYLKNYQNSIDTLQLGLLRNYQNSRLAVRFYTFLGENYQAVMNYDKSSYYFEKALLLEPENYYILNNYSYYLSLRSAYLDKALNYIQICLKGNPQSPTYLDTYGWILFKSGRFAEAKEIVLKALNFSSSNDISILEHYCQVLLKLGESDEASRYYKIYLNKGGNSENLKSLFDGKKI